MKPLCRFVYLVWALPLSLFLLASCGGEPAHEGPGDARPPSDVPEAVAAFEEAQELWGTDGPASLAKLHEAIALDPSFLEAVATLSSHYAWIYQQYDRSDSIAENALSFAEEAMALDPDAEGSIVAMAAYRYRVEKDYDRAMELYTRGAALFPENTHFMRMQAHIARREGDWDRALELLIQSEEVEPSLDALQAILENHRYNRRWDASEAAAQEYARRAPESTVGPSYLAWLHFYRDGDTGPLREFLATRPTGWATTRWQLEVLDRDYEAALAAIDASTTEVFTGQYALVPRGTYRGIALREMGDEASAMSAFQEARATMEAMLPELDEDCRVHGSLGSIYAFMGMKEAAVEEAQKAVDMLPPESDALVGPYNVLNLARVYATLGEAELAVEQLRYLQSIPSAVIHWNLERGQVWDPIREHPAFQALLQG